MVSQSIRSFLRRGFINQISRFYYLSLAFTTFGSLQLFTGVFGPPFIQSLSLLEAHHASGNRTYFGSLGYCFEALNSPSWCISPKVGYQGDRPKISPQQTAPLFLHVVAFALGLLSILTTAFARSRREIHAKWILDCILTIITLSAFIFDIFLFAASQHTARTGSSMQLGNASWFTLLACAMFLLGSFTYAYGRNCAKKRDFEKQRKKQSLHVISDVSPVLQNDETPHQNPQDDFLVLRTILQNMPINSRQPPPLPYGFSSNVSSLGESGRFQVDSKGFRQSVAHKPSFSSLQSSPEDSGSLPSALSVLGLQGSSYSVQDNLGLASNATSPRPSVIFEGQNMPGPPTPDEPYRPYSRHHNKGLTAKKTNRQYISSPNDLIITKVNNEIAVMNSFVNYIHPQFSASVSSLSSTLSTLIREFPVPEEASPDLTYRPYLTQNLGLQSMLPYQASLPQNRTQSSAMSNSAISNNIAQTPNDSHQASFPEDSRQSFIIHSTVNMPLSLNGGDAGRQVQRISCSEKDPPSDIEKGIVIMIHSPCADHTFTPSDSS